AKYPDYTQNPSKSENAWVQQLRWQAGCVRSTLHGARSQSNDGHSAESTLCRKPTDNVVTVNGGDRGRTGLAHYYSELPGVNVEYCFDARLPKSSQSPCLRAADTDRRRPQCERLEYVGAASNAAIDQYWDSAPDRCDYLG